MYGKFIPSSLAAAIILAALFIPWPFRTLPLPARELLDAMHLPLMLGITLWIAWLFDFKASVLKVCSLALFLELLIEIVQPLTGRSAELRDIINGLIGILLTLPILVQLKAGKERLKMTIAGCTTVALFLLLAEALPPSTAYMGFRSQYPILSDFDDPWYKYLWHSGFDGNEGLDCQVEYGHENRIPFACKATQPGINSVEFSPGPMDWSAYQVLAVDVSNPGEAFELHIRVDDSESCKDYSCRFTYVAMVPPGRTVLKVPFTRPGENSNQHILNLTNIIRLVLFTKDVEVGRSFYLNSLQLIPEESKVTLISNETTTPLF
jgi:hypothetical protein